MRGESLFGDDADLKQEVSIKSHNSRVAAVRHACQQSDELRTEDEISTILDFVKDVKFFSKLDRLQQRALCRSMTHEEIGGDCFIFKQGEQGDKFYIILSGSVSVHVPRAKSIVADGVDDPTAIQVLNKTEEMLHTKLQTKSGGQGIMGNSAVFLDHGMGFGELALQSEKARSATVIANEKTELLVITRAMYERHAGRAHREFIEDRIRFLRQIGYVEQALQVGKLQVVDIAQMAGCLHELSLTGGQIAIHQGAQVDNAVFVRSGQLAVIRSIDVEEARKTSGAKFAYGIGGEHSGHNSSPQATSNGPTNTASLVQSLARALNQQDAASSQVRSDTNVLGGSCKGEGGATLAKTPRRTIFPQATGKANPPFVACEPEDFEQKKQQIQFATQSQWALASAGDDASKTHIPSGKTKANSPWTKLRSALRQATVVNSLLKAPEADETSELEKAHKSVEHFMEVQQIRKRIGKMEQANAFTKNALKAQESSSLNKRKSMAAEKHGSGPGSMNTVALPPRRVLLRVGTLSPFQVFGDITSNDPYPASLVCDPGAELYMITKNDLMRRLPKKLSEVIFSRSLSLPPDGQLLDMYRQTARWNHFRKGLQHEAIAASGRGGHGSTAIANLEFLGIQAPPSARSGPPSRRKAGALTQKDKIHFSQSPSVFLRRYGELSRDPRTQRTAAGDGSATRSFAARMGEEDDRDPMDYVQDKMWDQLGADIGLNLDEALVEESSATQLVTESKLVPPVDDTSLLLSDSGSKRPPQYIVSRTPSPRESTILQHPVVSRRVRNAKALSPGHGAVTRSRQSSAPTPPPPRPSSLDPSSSPRHTMRSKRCVNSWKLRIGFSSSALRHIWFGAMKQPPSS